MNWTIIGLISLIVLFLIMKVYELQSRLKRMEIYLKGLETHIGLTEHPINNELRLLVSEGKRVPAIKKAREAMGISLKEAKEYVEVL